MMKADDCANDINNGVQGANLMEMYPVHRDSVDLGLGSCQGPEDLARPIYYRLLKFTFFKDMQNARQGSEFLSAVTADGDFNSTDCIDTFLFNPEFKPFQMKFGKFFGQDFTIKAGMQECSEQHISADAGKAVQISYSGER